MIMGKHANHSKKMTSLILWSNSFVSDFGLDTTNLAEVAFLCLLQTRHMSFTVLEENFT